MFLDNKEATMSDNPLDGNKIAAEVITDLAKTMGSKLFEKVSKFVKTSMVKSEIDLGNAFENYLNHAKDCCEKIKTLLYRHQPKELYSFYQPMSLKNGKKIVDTSDLNNVIAISNTIIITGTGGSGKTIMMKHFFLDCIYQKTSVPVLIELRGLNGSDPENISIIDFVYEKMQTMKLNLEKEYFEYALKAGCFLLLFDGYDEVTGTLCNTVTQQINDIANEYNHNYFIVSSRPSTEFVGWNNFVELPIEPLSKEQALSLIKKLDYEESIKTKFYEQLESNLFEKYETFASNPLLLTIMLLTFEASASIPDNLNDFYEQAFTALFHEHDATKGAYKRDIASKLGCGDFKRVFSHFCFKSFFNDQYEFTESQAIKYIEDAKSKVTTSIDVDPYDFLKDTTDSVCMLVHEGLNYRFSHRSFQEYFAALYTTKLDDSTQSKLITNWLKESGQFLLSSFLPMLNELQKERVFKNVLKPALEKLETLFIENDSSYEWLIIFVWGEIGSIINDEFYVTSMDNNNNKDYYDSIIFLTCKFYGYDFNNEEKFCFINRGAIKKILAPLKKKVNKNSFSFKELEKEGVLSNIIENCPWLEKQIKFALDVLHQYQKNDMLDENANLKSIVDEL